MILDQFGLPFEIPKKPDSRQIASVSVRDRYGTYSSAGLTPQKLAAILRAADQGDVYSQAELFEEMEEKDAHLSGELLKRKNAVNGLDYDILPYEAGARTSAARAVSEAESARITEFCRDVIFSLDDFDVALFDLLDAIGKGYAASEITWDLRDGRQVIQKLERIDQKRLVFVDSLIPKITTDDNINGVEIPPFKVIYHRHRARSGYDTRAGMLRVCTWMYLFKNYAVKDWVAFAEVFGMPLRLGRYEPGAGKDDKDALVAAIKSLGSDAAGIISKNTEIEFVEAAQKGGSTIVYKILADFCNREMSKAIIGSTLTSEAGDKGSYALGKTHNEVRLDLVKSDASSLSQTLRMQLLRPLIGFNFGWDKPVPWFKFYLPKSEDLKTLSEVYKNLVDLGQPISQEHISKRFNIPLPEDGETPLEPPARQTPAVFKRFALKSAQERFSQEDVTNLSRQAAKAAEAAISRLLKSVLEMIEGAQSLEEIGEKIYTLYPDLDSDAFQELLARSMFAASLTGHAAAEGEED